MSTNTNRSHSGKIVSGYRSGPYRLLDCRECGYLHCHPLPTERALRAFYAGYYTKEKPNYLADHERDWEWWQLWYNRWVDMFRIHAPDARILVDYGCGPGGFLAVAQQRGYKAWGIEPNPTAAAYARKRGCRIIRDMRKADIYYLSEVLEHIRDPRRLLTQIHAQLNDNGLLFVLVPQDNTKIQRAIRNKTWFSPPAHLNYFQGDTLVGLVRKCGYSVITSGVTFPIDAMCILGLDYYKDPKLGPVAHHIRKRIETKLWGPEYCGVILGALSGSGVGRECWVLAQKINDEPKYWQMG